MRIRTAQLPDAERSQDRAFVTTQAVVVLDGASPFVPVDVPTTAYVDVLGREISNNVHDSPDRDLAEIVAGAIATTVHELNLAGDASPSSTITILRAREDRVELYTLGDSALYYGNEHVSHELIDYRLDDLCLPERTEYRRRLSDGCGYDDTHRELLAALQRRQRTQRNREGGYWIAAAEPEAAHQAFMRNIPAQDLTWAVLATDGAYEPMVHLGLDGWHEVSRMDEAALVDVLTRCRTWLKQSDPDGATLPRSKVADDMTLAAIDFNSL